MPAGACTHEALAVHKPPGQAEPVVIVVWLQGLPSEVSVVQGLPSSQGANVAAQRKPSVRSACDVAS